jgi:hypothetical protein
LRITEVDVFPLKVNRKIRYLGCPKPS